MATIIFNTYAQCTNGSDWTSGLTFKSGNTLTTGPTDSTSIGNLIALKVTSLAESEIIDSIDITLYLKSTYTNGTDGFRATLHDSYTGLKEVTGSIITTGKIDDTWNQNKTFSTSGSKISFSFSSGDFSNLSSGDFLYLKVYTGDKCTCDTGSTYNSVQANVIVTDQTVTFNGNGGTPDYTSKTYTVGSTYGSLPGATRSGGYMFLGWFTSISSGIQITTSSTVTNAASRTLYARWKEIKTTPEVPEIEFYGYLLNEWGSTLKITQTDQSESLEGVLNYAFDLYHLDSLTWYKSSGYQTSNSYTISQINKGQCLRVYPTIKNTDTGEVASSWDDKTYLNIKLLNSLERKNFKKTTSIISFDLYMEEISYDSDDYPKITLTVTVEEYKDGIKQRAFNQTDSSYAAGNTSNFSFDVKKGYTYIIYYEAFCPCWDANGNTKEDTSNFYSKTNLPADTIVINDVNEWTWNPSNNGTTNTFLDSNYSAATANELYNAYIAITNKGATKDFSHNVWNDICQKAAEVVNEDLDDAKMSGSPYILTAAKFNQVAKAVGYSNSSFSSGDRMLGEYFTGLTDAINNKI